MKKSRKTFKRERDDARRERDDARRECDDARAVFAMLRRHFYPTSLHLRARKLVEAELRAYDEKYPNDGPYAEKWKLPWRERFPPQLTTLMDIPTTAPRGRILPMREVMS
jgi:hypothetical protein